MLCRACPATQAGDRCEGLRVPLPELLLLLLQKPKELEADGEGQVSSCYREGPALGPAWFSGLSDVGRGQDASVLQVRSCPGESRSRTPQPQGHPGHRALTLTPTGLTRDRLTAPSDWSQTRQLSDQPPPGLQPVPRAGQGQVFHCVHFECPEQQSIQKDENNEELGTGDGSPATQQIDPHTLRAPGTSSLPPSPGPNACSPNRQHQ
ncbi:BTB/POZ domain-containing protein 9 [Heterocephalus glaber]|uniref:BTB/POZ domain-containing protein 9 n=1 Tax=Heterocephalus glaber TaxID=10181 RepID=G5B9F8_HETGA|nr:BTB/POZ domain-containing protein 9 [Heterocephalus glaber]